MLNYKIRLFQLALLGDFSLQLKTTHGSQFQLLNTLVINPNIPFKFPKKKKTNNSFIQKGLLLGWSIISQYSKWSIGNGKSINFWIDPWITTTSTPLTNLIQGPLNKFDHLLRVDSLIQNQRWNLSQISYSLPNSLKEIINDTIIPTTLHISSLPDSIFQTMSPNVQFTTSSCYQALILSKTNLELNINWLWLKLKFLKRSSFSFGFVDMIKSRTTPFFTKEVWTSLHIATTVMKSLKILIIFLDTVPQSNQSIPLSLKLCHQHFFPSYQITLHFKHG